MTNNDRIKPIQAKSILSPTKIPGADYAANPYVGCLHSCRYCYASFMKRFTGHREPWGTFLDIKEWEPLKRIEKYKDKDIFIGTVTDPYQSMEEEWGRTRELLLQLQGSGARLTIVTKSDLVLRDRDLLKTFEDVTVAFSINTVDGKFQRDMEKAPSVERRIRAMEVLKEEGIHTATFISPIFPGITEVPAIVEATRGKCDEYWLENLNLRGDYKQDILRYIYSKYPELKLLYQGIYQQGDKEYWRELSKALDHYAEEENLSVVNYFYHELIRKK